MGWFKKTFSGRKLGRIGLAIGTGGMSEVANAATGGKLLKKGGLEDVLLGSKSGGSKADAIAAQIKATQAKGLGELNSALNTPSENIVREQVTREKAGVLSSAQDARRNAQSMMARQGLKGTSLQAASERSLAQTTGNQLATIDAKIPGAIRNQQINDAQTRANAGGLANAGNIQFRDVAAKRSGGLLGIASAVAPIAGMAMGGPMGAAAGKGLGQIFAQQDMAGGQTGYSTNYLSGNTGGY